MGSLRRPKSTRAQRGRSVPTLPKPRRRPAPKPAHRLRATSDALRAIRDAVPMAGALRQIRDRLAIARATAYVGSAALKAQGADIDVEVSLTLKRSVGDELDKQIERIDSLIRSGGGAP